MDTRAYIYCNVNLTVKLIFGLFVGPFFVDTYSYDCVMVVERDTNLVIFFDLSILQPWEVDHFEPNLWDLHWFTLPKTHLAPENGPGPKRKVVFHSFRPSILRCYVSIRECRIRRSQQRCRIHPEPHMFSCFFGGKSKVHEGWARFLADRLKNM